jgi:hypothetical protein
MADYAVDVLVSALLHHQIADVMTMPPSSLSTQEWEKDCLPKDVVCVRIDPSILVIPEHAFFLRCKLETIELHNILREIGNDAFSMCTALREVHLSDGVESIGYQAFYHCNFTKFRSPPLVTTVPYSMLGKCPRLFFLALIIRVEVNAFLHCYSLRNVALGWWTFYSFLALSKQLLVPLRSDLLSFQFTARCTTNLTTIK